MNGGFNSDGTAWLSPEGARFLAEQYVENHWIDYEIVKQEYDKKTIEMFLDYVVQLKVKRKKDGTYSK